MRTTEVAGGRRSAGVLTLGWGTHAPERRGCPTEEGNPVSRDPGIRGICSWHGCCRRAMEAAMLWTIAVILLVLWALGMITSYTVGGRGDNPL